MPGSSGSPCFNANLELVALHHAGDPTVPWEQPEWNQAIPVQNIVADLIAQGVDRKLWEP
jgi:V8-like Glu-specific endopeptidase